MDVNRQTRKRLETRQHISDVATGLFMKHGFDAVTIGEIAEAADVSRMTVFNHFARKEDMFFDLGPLAQQEMLAAVRDRAPGVSPIQALQQFAHAAIKEQRPYACFFQDPSARFLATVHASETLQAHARAIRDQLASELETALIAAVRRRAPDPAAALAANLLLATWTVALDQGFRHFQQHKSAAKARRAFLDIVDQGTRGIEAALAGTPYV